jgi:hypothetical protein
MSISKNQIKAVLEALENEKFKWRTIDGVIQETGLSTEQVIDALGAASDKIVKSSILSPEGQGLFTTREHFRKKSSTFEKLLGAIKNRAE